MTKFLLPIGFLIVGSICLVPHFLGIEPLSLTKFLAGVIAGVGGLILLLLTMLKK